MAYGMQVAHSMNISRHVGGACQRRSFATNNLARPSPVKWGILSTSSSSSSIANIGQAISYAKDAQVAAVSSFVPDSREDVAQRIQQAMTGDRHVKTRGPILGRKVSDPQPTPLRHYQDYQEMLSDPSIDAVYIHDGPNDNDKRQSSAESRDLAYQLALQSLASQKATFFPSSSLLTYRQCWTLTQQAQANQSFFMEGSLWTKTFPAYAKAADLLQSGAIGRPLIVQGSIGTQDVTERDGTSMAATLYAGQFMVHWGQVVFGTHSRADAIQAMHCSVSNSLVAHCQYTMNDNDTESGLLQFSVAPRAENRITIQGTKGRIIIDPPAHLPERVRLETDRVSRSGSQQHQRRLPPRIDTYLHPLPNYPGVESLGLIYPIASVGQALGQGLLECPGYTWNDTLQVAAMMEVIRSKVVGAEPVPRDSTQTAINGSVPSEIMDDVDAQVAMAQ